MFAVLTAAACDTSAGLRFNADADDGDSDGPGDGVSATAADAPDVVARACAMRLAITSGATPSTLLFVHLEGAQKDKTILLLGGSAAEQVAHAELTGPHFWVQIGSSDGFGLGTHPVDLTVAPGAELPIHIEWNGAATQGQLRLVRPGCAKLVVDLRGTP